jgi:hypothetical protein
MRTIYPSLVGMMLLVSSPRVVQAGYVLPQLGGGQVNQAGAPMKHADITLIGTTLNVHVDTTVPIPLLRSLTAPDEFDVSMPWSVLQEKAHNFQYGWNPSGFWAPPPGTAVWIEQLEVSAGLEVYYVAGLPISPPYDPIFGTEGSSTRWQWDGFMTHNAYAVLNPSESTYQATYKVYFGDQNTGVETSGYIGAEVQFDFIADPILTADFNEDSFVNSDDMAIWKQHFGTSSGATNDQGDTSSDGDVDGHDLLHWQRQFTGGEINSAIMLGSVPEPSTIVLAFVAFGMMAVSRCGQ